MSQIGTRGILDDAIDDSKIRLRSDQPIRSRNNADSADLSWAKTDSSDKLVFILHPQVSTAPTVAADVANKSYVDSIAAGLDPKESARISTVSDISGTYAAGGGAGGTGEFTAVDLTNAAIFDGLVDSDAVGITLAIGDRILIKDQTDAKQNGLYVVTTAGAAGVIERSSDHDGSPSSEVSSGNYTFVEGGTVHNSQGWIVIGDGELTLNTDDIDWSQNSGAGSVSAGAGLDQTGNNLFIAAADTSMTIGSDDISVKRDPAGAITLDAGSAGIEVNVDGSTIAISSNALEVPVDGIDKTRIDADVAGAGLSQAAGGELDVNLDAAGGLELNVDDIRINVDATNSTTSIVGNELVSLRPATEVITLDGTDISNGYVDILQDAADDNVRVSAFGGVVQEPTTDFTVSGSPSRVTFAGDLSSLLISGDKLVISYNHL